MPAALLAAQLEADSGFAQSAGSPAGVEGIARFMPPIRETQAYVARVLAPARGRASKP